MFSGISLSHSTHNIRGYATYRKHRYGGKLNKVRVSHNDGTANAASSRSSWIDTSDS